MDPERDCTCCARYRGTTGVPKHPHPERLKLLVLEDVLYFRGDDELDHYNGVRRIEASEEIHSPLTTQMVARLDRVKSLAASDCKGVDFTGMKALEYLEILYDVAGVLFAPLPSLKGVYIRGYEFERGAPGARDAARAVFAQLEKVPSIHLADCDVVEMPRLAPCVESVEFEHCSGAHDLGFLEGVPAVSVCRALHDNDLIFELLATQDARTPGHRQLVNNIIESVLEQRRMYEYMRGVVGDCRATVQLGESMVTNHARTLRIVLDGGELGAYCAHASLAEFCIEMKSCSQKMHAIKDAGGLEK